MIEADETYAGGKAKNRAFKERPKKEAVFSLVERDGKVRSKHVTDVTSRTLREQLVTQASRNSYLMTDEAPVYKKVGREFTGHGSASEALKGAEGKRVTYRRDHAPQ